MPEPKFPQGANLPTPQLPGFFAPQPTSAERAAIEAQWAAMRDAPRSLAMLVLWIDAHPEIRTWARATVSEPFKFSE